MLYQVITSLWRRAWLIALGAALCGGLAVLLVLIWSPSYTATASLVITKSRPSVSLDPAFVTLSEEDRVNLSVQESNVRRQTLLGLISSNEVAQQAFSALEPSRRGQAETPPQLAQHVDVSTQGNLIYVEASAGKPASAAAIADAWARASEQVINALYSEASPSEAELEAQVQAAWSDYQAAEAELIGFLETSPQAELNRQLSQIQGRIDQLEQAYRQEILADLTSALALSRNAEIQAAKLEGLRVYAAGMPGAAALTPGEQMAMLLTIAISLAGDQPSLPSALQVDLTPGTEPPQTYQEVSAQLERLAEALASQRDALQTYIGQQTRLHLQPTDLLAAQPEGAEVVASIQALQTEANRLQAEAEQALSERTGLQDRRNLAHESYLTLARKANEVRIASQVTGSEVRLATTAAVPEQPSFPRTRLTILAGVLLGASAGAGLAIAIDWWASLRALSTSA